jgi:hypothetical protein
MRVDSGFWAKDTITTLRRLDVRFTMAVRCGFKAVAAAIDQIDENAWIDIKYPDGGVAQVAETTYTTGRHTLRLVVRRTRLTARSQQQLWPDWRHHAFLTDLDGDVVHVDRFHRQHATIELAIRDLKEGAGLEHVPSGRFHANSAWLQCAVLAHNLTRWTAVLGEVHVEINSSSRAASAPACSPCPPDSSTAPGDQRCACRPTGRGPTSSSPRSTRCATCNPPPADIRPLADGRTAPPTTR